MKFNFYEERIDYVLQKFSDYRRENEEEYFTTERVNKIKVFDALQVPLKEMEIKPQESRAKLAKLMLDDDISSKLDTFLTNNGPEQRKDFKIFLENTDIDRLHRLFQIFLEEDKDIKERIIRFRGLSHNLYRRYYLDGLFSENRKIQPEISLNLASIFLSSYDRNNYILYKYTEYEQDLDFLGIDVIGVAEEKYERCLNIARKIYKYAQENNYYIEDLIDIHNLILRGKNIL